MAISTDRLNSAVSHSRRRELVELAVGYGLILVVIWTPRPWQRMFYVAALLWIAATTWISFDGWKVMGLKTTGLLRSFWVVGMALAVAIVAVLIAMQMDTLNRPHGVALFIKTFWGYAIWSFLQQFLLQDFVLLRLLRLVSSKRTAVMLAAGMFALAHLPSPILTVVTLVWGSIACWFFLRYRNVYTLGMAHAILGVCLAIVVPGHVDHNMRVGLGYLRFQRHRQHSNSSDRTAPKDVWVMADDPMRPS